MSANSGCVPTAAANGGLIPEQRIVVSGERPLLRRTFRRACRLECPRMRLKRQLLKHNRNFARVLGEKAPEGGLDSTAERTLKVRELDDPDLGASRPDDVPRPGQLRPPADPSWPRRVRGEQLTPDNKCRDSESAHDQQASDQIGQQPFHVWALSDCEVRRHNTAIPDCAVCDLNALMAAAAPSDATGGRLVRAEHPRPPAQATLAVTPAAEPLAAENTGATASLIRAVHPTAANCVAPAIRADARARRACLAAVLLRPSGLGESASNPITRTAPASSLILVTLTGPSLSAR